MAKGFTQQDECGLCGHPDARHRVIEAQMENVIAGDPIDFVARAHDQTAAEMVRDWRDHYVRLGEAFKDVEMSLEAAHYDMKEMG